MKKKEIRRILVIRFRRVGDAVISTVLCSTLKKTFPQARIDYVLNEGIMPLFEHHPDIDRIIPFSQYDMDSFGRYIKKVRKIVREGKYDMIVDTRSTVKTLWFSLFSLSTPYRIGRRKPYNRFLNNMRASDVFAPSDDEVVRTLRMLQPLEKIYPLQYVSQFRLYVAEQEKDDFRKYMIEKGIDFSKPVIVCAVTARLERKRWKKEYMWQTLQFIIDKYDAQLVFNYDKDEKDYAFDLYEKMGRNPHIFINIEAKGLRQLSALMANSNFFYGNEGGPRHIAQAFEVPGFAIYSPQISKPVWLTNASSRYQGIEPRDILSSADLEKLSYEEQFYSITPEIVEAKLTSMLDDEFKGKNNLSTNAG